MLTRFEQLKAGWLAALATGFMWVEWSLARGALSHAGGPVPWAVAFDMMCVFPAAYWLLVLRPASRPLLELVPVLGGSWLCARAALAHCPQLHVPLHVWSAVLELAVVGIVIQGSARLFRDRRDAHADLLFHLQQVREPVLRAVGLELCVFYYALFARFRQRPADAGRAFDTGHSARQLLLALGLVSVLEAVGVHVILQAYWPRLAWFALALTAYGLLWIIAAQRAFRLRPLLVSPDHILVRASLLFSARLDRTSIVRVEAYGARGRVPGVARLTFATQPNLLLSLREPAATYGPFGRLQYADRIALQVEQPQALMQLLQSTPFTAAEGGKKKRNQCDR